MLSIVSGPFDECKDPLECAEKLSLGTIRANKYLSIYLEYIQAGPGLAL